MTRKTALMLMVATMIVLQAGCGKKDEAVVSPVGAGSAPAPSSPAERDVVTLTGESSRYAQLGLTEVVARELVSPIEATGLVALNEDRTTRVGAFIDGRVIKVQVKVGDRVREGQILAEIHTHDVHEAGANLVQARANLTQKKNQAAFARTSYDRADRLYQAKALSKQELDRARVEFESSQQDVVHAEAELERARGHLELLGLAPDKLDYDAPVFIRAPESGVIMQRQITTGASVNPGDHLFTISELGQLWVLAEVEEKRLAQLRVGAPVTIEVAAFPGQGFPGKIARIGDVLNPQTRMIEVRCLVDNRSGRLKPEMYAVTRIAAGEKTLALVVPKAAIQDVGGQSVVFVAREGQSYQKKIVRLGREDGDQVEILEGLKAGEKVVSTGGFLLKSELQKSQME
jgi:cobalt-zinc-cadmium efflux system membrane fusion protein